MKEEDMEECLCIRDHLKFKAPLSHSHRVGDNIYLRLRRPACWKISALCFSFCFYISGYKHHRNCCHALNTLRYQNLVKCSYQLLSGTQGTSGRCGERFLVGQFGVSGVGLCCALPSGAISFSGDCRESGWLHKITTQAQCGNLPVKSRLAEVVRKSLFTSVHPGFHLQQMSVMCFFIPSSSFGGSVCWKHSRKEDVWHCASWVTSGTVILQRLLRVQERIWSCMNRRATRNYGQPTLFSWGASLLGSLANSFQLASWSHEGGTK